MMREREGTEIKEGRKRERERVKKEGKEEQKKG